MPQSVQVKPISMDIEESENENLFHKVFQPTFLLMKIAGLCPKILGISRPSHDRKSKILSLLYSAGVVVMILFHISRIAPYLNVKASFALYLRLCVFVWYLRCLVLALYSIRITSYCKERKSMLGCLIQSLDEDIDNSHFKTNKSPIKRFKMKTKILFLFICCTIVMSSAFVGVAILAKIGSGIISITLLSPFQDNIVFQIIYTITNIYMVTAWIVPVLLYSNICNSLIMKLTFLQSTVASVSDSINMQHHIRAIRRMYLNVTDIVSKADEIFGPVALFIYFFDIVLFSITLYASIFIQTSAIGHLNLGFWNLVAFLNLLLVSTEAAQVEEKVILSNISPRSRS